MNYLEKENEMLKKTITQLSINLKKSNELNGLSSCDKRWLSPVELQKKYGFSTSTQAKYRIARKIPFSKLGKYIRYDKNEIDRWLENNSKSVIK